MQEETAVSFSDSLPLGVVFFVSFSLLWSVLH